MLPPLLAAVSLCGGCATVGSLDRAVERRYEGIRDVLPAQGTNTLADAFAAPAPARPAEPLTLDLAATLRLATQCSRRLQSRREQLYLSGVSALASLRAFGPQYSGTLRYVLSRPEGGALSQEASWSGSASQVLPLGGSLLASVSEGRTETADTDGSAGATTYSGSASVEVRQPLLAGAGYAASHEAAVAAERALADALRSFALERQDFAIGIVGTFHNLLIGRAVLENTRVNFQQAVYLRRRSEALFRIRRAASLDVLRSEQQELASSNALAAAEADYRTSIQRFLLELGLPVDTPVMVTGEIPALEPVTLELEPCIALALERRLDLVTARQRVGDAERQLRLARNARRPDLEAYAGVSTSGSSTESVADQDYQREVTAGATLDVPWDLRGRRDDVRRAQIGLDAARRDMEEKRDGIRVDLTESFVRLKTLESSAQIAQRNTEIAQRRADYAALRFRNGELSNRDVVEAQDELLSARNAYVRALASYEEQRLRLLRNTGLLDVAPDGTLVELQP
jgi:outer membrane protein TolC